MARVQNLAVVVTCLVAAMTYAGAVTMTGMALFVLPGVVGAALLASFLAARRMSGIALLLGGALLLGWSELVNVWSGTAYGTAARSTFIAGGCTLVAVVVARSDSPTLFLLPIAGSVCGALLLGAGGEVRLVAVVAAVSAALTLGSIERSRRNWTARPRREGSLVLLPLLVGAVAVGVVLLQAQRDRRQPEALAAGQVYPHLKPPWTDPLAKAANSVKPPPRTRGTAPPPPPQSQPKPPRNRRHNPPQPKPVPQTTHAPRSRVWLYVVAGVLLLALVLVARLLAVRMAWRRMRRRLSTGSPADQVTGAWAWIRIRLEAYRLPLAVAVSPDRLALGGVLDDLSPEASGRLEFLAATTTLAAFAGEGAVAPADGTAAWKAAGQVEASARTTVPRRRRVGLALRGPATRSR